jgi:hypothetical protein
VSSAENAEIKPIGLTNNWGIVWLALASVLVIVLGVVLLGKLGRKTYEGDLLSEQIQAWLERKGAITIEVNV